jgi:hypothetical protein
MNNDNTPNSKGFVSLLLVLLLLSSFAGMASAGTCTVTTQCPTNSQCTDQVMTLAWSDKISDTLTINGDPMPAHWRKGPTMLDEIQVGETTNEISAQGPMILVSQARKWVTIVPAPTQDEVIVTYVNILRKYIDYEDATDNRAVLSGLCQGLF